MQSKGLEDSIDIPYLWLQVAFTSLLVQEGHGGQIRHISTKS